MNETAKISDKMYNALFKLDRNIDLLSVVTSAITDGPHALEQKEVGNSLFEIVLNITDAFEGIKECTGYK